MTGRYGKIVVLNKNKCGGLKKIAERGKQLIFESFLIHRISGGKVVQQWAISDVLG